MAESNAIDLQLAEKTFGRMRAGYEALSRDVLVRPRIGVIAAVLVAFDRLSTTRDEPLADMLARLAKAGFFDMALLDALADAAHGAYWAAYRFDQERNKSTAMLPAVVVDEATTLRDRMDRCASYNLDDVPEVAVEIERIRAGRGYLDLMNDLAAWARIYTEHRDKLRGDKKRYRAKDGPRAAQLAGEIGVALGASKTEGSVDWSDMNARAFTKLVLAYEEVAHPARFVLRDDGRRWPSLYAVLRAAPASESGGDEGGGGEGGGGEAGGGSEAGKGEAGKGGEKK